MAALSSRLLLSQWHRCLRIMVPGAVIVTVAVRPVPSHIAVCAGSEEEEDAPPVGSARVRPPGPAAPPIAPATGSAAVHRAAPRGLPVRSDSSDDNGASDVLEMLGPLAAQVSFGGALGFCSGIALKKASKAAAVAVGMLFIGVQALSFMGYIHVRWGKLQRDILAHLDADGDGKLTTNDFAVLWRKLLTVLRFNLPSAGGFGSGLLLGLRWG